MFGDSYFEYEGQLVYEDTVQEWTEDELLDRRFQLEEIDYRTHGLIIAVEEEISVIEREIERRDEEAGK